MATKSSQIADGFQQVGLTLPVGADEGRHPGREEKIQRWIGPEVHQ